MRKNIIEKNGKTPKTNEDWFNIAPPAMGRYQWKALHSASELADYCLYYSNEVPAEIDEVLDEIGSQSNSFHSEPERETDLLPEEFFGSGEPRHHDLLMIGEDVVVGVEAKATEDLDKPVSKYNGQNPRYSGLCEHILGRKFEECGHIMYQLLSSTAGTLIEASNAGVSKAVLIVLLFNSWIVPKSHVEKTRKHIEDFKDLLKELPMNKGAIECFKTPFKPEIDLYIKYLVVDVCSYHKTNT